MNSQFANYKNGELTVNTHRFADATTTDIQDILNANENQSDEILCASIDIGESTGGLTAVEIWKDNKLVWSHHIRRIQ